MIVLNIALMTLVALGIVSLLSWAIVSDRRSKRTAGGDIAPSAAPMHHNLVMPRELRVHRAPKFQSGHGHQSPARSAA